MKRGFTLIELLFVVSTISLLSSVVLSSLNQARKSAMNTVVTSESRVYMYGLEQLAKEINLLPLPSSNIVYCLSGPCLMSGTGYTVDADFVNTALGDYIIGKPTGKKYPVSVYSQDNQGIIFICLTSNNLKCTQFFIQWPIFTSNTGYCLPGLLLYTDNVNSVCYYSVKTNGFIN